MKLNNDKSSYSTKFFLFLLLLIGVLGVIDTMLLIPVTSSITLGMAFPAVMGIFLITFSIINLKKRKPFFKNKTLLTIIYIAVTACALFFLVIEAFIWQGAHSDKAQNTESNFVIVLGCGIFPDGRLTLALQNRLDAAYEYMQRYPEAICVVSGGQGSNEPIPEGQAMAEYLLGRGMSEERILREQKATSTKTNLLYSSEIIDENYPEAEKTVAVVSSDFHMFRVRFLSKRFGMDAIGIPAPTSWYIRPNCYIREFFAVIKSYLIDR